MDLMLALRTLDPAMAQQWLQAFRDIPGAEIRVDTHPGHWRNKG